MTLYEMLLDLNNKRPAHERSMGRPPLRRVISSPEEMAIIHVLNDHIGEELTTGEIARNSNTKRETALKILHRLARKNPLTTRTVKAKREPKMNGGPMTENKWLAHAQVIGRQ